MEALCTSGINSRIISIETLNYPLEWVEEILIGFNLSVCMDLGHLILYGLDMKDVFDRYKNRTSIIHLHGANEHRDHKPLEFLSSSNLKTILEMLKQFKGVVSLFHYEIKELFRRSF
jgi:sugar phosphate isomerase/epimerase